MTDNELLQAIEDIVEKDYKTDKKHKWIITDWDEDFIQLCCEKAFGDGSPYCVLMEIHTPFGDWPDPFVVWDRISLDDYDRSFLLEIAAMYGYTTWEWDNLSFHEKCECVFESEGFVSQFNFTFKCNEETFEYFMKLYQRADL